jgi:hypothetical protein
MTVTIAHEHEHWRASVRDGVWSSAEPGIAAFLQATTDSARGYKPDREWTLAVIVRDAVPGVTIVSKRPAVTIDPTVVY